MKTEQMQKLMDLPRGRWMILDRGLVRSLQAELSRDYTNHTLIQTPSGPLRVLRMGRTLVAGRGGSYDVYAVCNPRQAPVNPLWDDLGRMVVDKDTRLAEVEPQHAVTPMAAWASETERAEALAELRELRAERQALIDRAALEAKRYETLRATVAKNADRLEAQTKCPADAAQMEMDLDQMQEDMRVAAYFTSTALAQVDAWTSYNARVVVTLLESALKVLRGHG